MKYQIEENIIKIFSKDQFNPTHFLECGQVFCFKKEGEKYIVFPQDKYAEITEKNDYFEIKVLKKGDISYFIDFFDLKTDYNEIKKELFNFNIMHKPLDFGYGIRILNQDLFETLVSFIISANNNIKRIKMILNNLRQHLGKPMYKDIYSFPTYENMLACDENFFKKMGSGYRASYLFKVLRQINPNDLQEMKKLSTAHLQQRLISLSGIGPKVADCIMLFGFHREDVFPVDTWIHQMYNQFYSPLENRNQIRKNLIDEFGKLSGYAQQYLFYYQRDFISKSWNFAFLDVKRFKLF